MKTSDMYLKIVEWSEEDKCYVGTCPGLMLGGVHGDNEARVFRELCRTVDEWIAIHKEDGQPLPPPTAGREYPVPRGEKQRRCVARAKSAHKTLPTKTER